MATSVSMVARVRGAILTVLKPVTGQCPRRQRTRVFIPHRFSHGVRSSLYEHVRAGYSDKPELDMRAVCEETDKVIANVESRKGDLQEDDVRKIVSLCVYVCSNCKNTTCQGRVYKMNKRGGQRVGHRRKEGG